ncbi:MAG TPA: DUF447 family protein [Candidatus Bathyarchaeota archaeon]|nr:DUF447 family protein [Candidatus Bathyarchaeota archaeon]
MTDVYNLGFLKDTIGETIVSTYDVDGHPNAAPMGIAVKSNEQLIIRPFMSSLTYKNLQTKRCAVVNVTSNPELFYRTAFKDANPDGNLSAELVEKAETVDAPRLRAADATVEVSVAETGSFSPERAEVLCNVQLVTASKALPKVYCRAQFATIEAIIHATRIKPFLMGDEQEQERALRLMELVEICRDIVDRTAPNSRYSEIMADLTQKIHLWRKESEGLR